MSLQINLVWIEEVNVWIGKLFPFCVFPLIWDYLRKLKALFHHLQNQMKEGISYILYIIYIYYIIIYIYYIYNKILLDIIYLYHRL